jgi:hypothetical protein
MRKPNGDRFVCVNIGRFVLEFVEIIAVLNDF